MKCDKFFASHDFDKWVEYSKNDIVRDVNERIGISIVQKRQCKECGYVEYKEQKIDLV